MAQQNINIGTSANKGDGDPLRTAFDKINDNFDELYLKVTNLETGGITVTKGDVQGSIFGDDSTLLVDSVNSVIPASVISPQVITLTTLKTEVAASTDFADFKTRIAGL